MSSNPQRDRLLVALYHDDSGERLARLATDTARRVRRRRQVRQTAAVAALLIILAAGLRWLPATAVHPRSRDNTVASTALTEKNPPPSPALSYETISDDQLLAALRDKPVLIVEGQNDGKRIVFLDRKRADR